MCCTDPTTTTSCCTLTMSGGGVAFPPHCGCGCIGKEQAASSLHRYREHLQAELNHIDARIGKLDGDSQ